VVGILGILSSLLFVSLDHHAGEEVSGRRREIDLAEVTPEPAASVD